MSWSRAGSGTYGPGEALGLSTTSRFFTTGMALLMLVGLLIGLPSILDYIRTGLVPRFPSAVLAASIELLAFMTFFLGLTLAALKRTKDESMRLAYLSMAPAPHMHLASEQSR